MARDVLLSVTHLCKDFGPVPVLKDLSFDVSQGESVCVWGPSGAGKSTLLHVLGLVTPPTSGHYALFGQLLGSQSDATLSRLRNEQIGFLFQFHYLLPDLTLWENVMIPLLIRRRPRAEAASKARALLEHLGVGHRLHHRPSETSGGEQQRAALARALVGKPRLLLADEPTGNLDRENGRAVEQLLKTAVQEEGATLILVTHNTELAGLCERKLELVDGFLKNDGPHERN